MTNIPAGKITVAPEVLLQIVEQAAMYTEGVVRMDSVPPRVDRIFRKIISSEGIEMEIDGDSLTIDLFLIVRATDMLALSHKIQKEVIRSVDKLVGLKVRAVNIHIEDVEYPENGS